MSKNSIARPIGGAVFYGLLVVICLVAIPYGTVETWWEALFAVLIFALGILWIIEGYLSGKWFEREHLLLLPLVALGLFALMQTWPLPFATSNPQPLVSSQRISADPFSTRFYALTLFALALSCALLLRYLTTNRRLQLLVWVLIGVALVSALFGILRQTTQREMGFLLPQLKPASGYGQFINRNHFALLMEMGFGLALGLLLGGGVKRERALFYLAPILPIWTALVLANSRGGIMSMLAQVMFAIVIAPARRRVGDSSGIGTLWRKLNHSLPFRMLLAACLLILIVAGVIWVGGDEVASRLESVRQEVSAENQEDTVRVDRKDIWRATWRLTKEHWFAGIGLGAYGVAITEFHQGSGQLVPKQAHNDYLELAASCGLIGVALGAWFVSAFIKRARRVMREADPFRRAACYGALIAIFGVAIHSLFDFGLHIMINSLVLMALIAIATARVSTEDPTL